MTDPAAPTPEELERDLARDLELCERAIPIRARDSVGDLERLEVEQVIDVGDLPLTFDELGDIEDLAGPIWDGLEFAAAARIGWPAAIRRALAAEARIERIEGAREWLCGSCNTVCSLSAAKRPTRFLVLCPGCGSMMRPSSQRERELEARAAALERELEGRK